MLSKLARLGAPPAGRALTGSALTTSLGLGKTPYSDEMPLGDLANRLADTLAPGSLLEDVARRSKGELPVICPLASRAANSSLLQSVLVHDGKFAKPRFTWYNPHESTWIPRGWLSEGLLGDLSYYFGDPHAASARMAASSALWRAACDELRDAQVAMAEEAAILDRAWLRASCPPTRAVRDRLKRAEAAAAHARIAYEHAAAVLAAEEAVALAWTGAEMQRASVSDMAEMMMEGDRSWLSPQLIRLAIAEEAQTVRDEEALWLGLQLQRTPEDEGAASEAAWTAAAAASADVAARTAGCYMDPALTA